MFLRHPKRGWWRGEEVARCSLLTRIEGVREFLDEIGHLDGDDDDGEADELDRQFERAVLGPDRDRGRVQEAEGQERLDGQQADGGGGRYELFHGGDSRRTKPVVAGQW